MIVLKAKTGKFVLRGVLTETDVKDMITMIEGAALPQRRAFENLKTDLKSALSQRE